MLHQSPKNITISLNIVHRRFPLNTRTCQMDFLGQEKKTNNEMQKCERLVNFLTDEKHLHFIVFCFILLLWMSLILNGEWMRSFFFYQYQCITRRLFLVESFIIQMVEWLYKQHLVPFLYFALWFFIAFFFYSKQNYLLILLEASRDLWKVLASHQFKSDIPSHFHNMRPKHNK